MSLIRKNNKQEFILDQPFANVFQILQSAANHVGSVVSAMPSTGMLRAKINKVPMVNAAVLRVSCERIDIKTTRVRVDSESMDGMIGVGSAGRCMDAYLEAVETLASGKPLQAPASSTKTLLIIAAVVALCVVAVMVFVK